MGCVRGRLAPLAGLLAALGVAVLALGPGLTGAQDGAAVAIVDFAFDPDLTGVAVGDTVTWTNYGAEHHTVTADDSTFTSGDVAPGESFSQSFRKKGSYTYRCRIHPSMTGTIVVNGAAGGTAGTGAGTENEMEAVPVVGVGTAAPRQAGGLALLAGIAAAVLGTTALALRRA